MYFTLASTCRILETVTGRLGLRMEAMKAPTNVFVIDSAKKPSEN